jgi:hypothetical protein
MTGNWEKEFTGSAHPSSNHPEPTGQTIVTHVRRLCTCPDRRAAPPPLPTVRPRYGFLRPLAPPTASSRPVTLIPSPLWPIDEEKSLSSSFPHSLALTRSSAPLAIAAADKPPRQASPEPPHRLLLSRPNRFPDVELSAAKQHPGVSQCCHHLPL